MTGLRLPAPHRNVPHSSSLDGLAPAFRAALMQTVEMMKKLGHQPRIFETTRTLERQAFLYGFGRTWDDGRGVVTHSKTNMVTWHGYGLAADIVEDDKTPWNATPAFWNDLGKCAEANGLTWGGRWKFLDLPHVQWAKCHRSPTSSAQFIAKNSGVEAVWRVYKAD